MLNANTAKGGDVWYDSKWHQRLTVRSISHPYIDLEHLSPLQQESCATNISHISLHTFEYLLHKCNMVQEKIPLNLRGITAPNASIELLINIRESG